MNDHPENGRMPGSEAGGVPAPGTLYLCATPIGNLGDITLRVLETLKQADLIAAEDTRNTLHLLTHFGIRKKLTSYHEHNKYEKAQVLTAELKKGLNIALVTDAGTPAISDPGEVLVRACIEEGIPVTSLPGACALITALTLSGKSAARFCFEGFLPADKKERRRILRELETEERTIILYEAPHHLKNTLEALEEHLGDRPLTLCRELTKRYEEAVPTSIRAALERFSTEDPRGEFVLVIEGRSPEEAAREREEQFADLSVAEHVAHYEEEGMTRKEAMKQAAEDRGISRRDVYQALLENGG